MYDTNRKVYAWGFFSCDASKNQCSVPACEAFPSKNCQIHGHEEKYGVGGRVKQLTAKQSTQKPPEVAGVDNGNMFKTQSAVKRDKEKILCVFGERMWHLSETEEKVCTPSMVLTTGLRRDERGTSPLQTVEKLVCSDGGGWLRSWLRIMHLFFLLRSSLNNNLLVLKIYMQRRKKYPFWNNRPIKPFFFFCNAINSFLKHKFGVSFPCDAEKTFTNINRLIKIVTFCTLLYRFKTQFKIQWRDPEILETLILQ